MRHDAFHHDGARSCMRAALHVCVRRCISVLACGNGWSASPVALLCMQLCVADSLLTHMSSLCAVSCRVSPEGFLRAIEWLPSPASPVLCICARACHLSDPLMSVLDDVDAWSFDEALEDERDLAALIDERHMDEWDSLQEAERDAHAAQHSTSQPAPDEIPPSQSGQDYPGSVRIECDPHHNGEPVEDELSQRVAEVLDGCASNPSLVSHEKSSVALPVQKGPSRKRLRGKQCAPADFSAITRPFHVLRNNEHIACFLSLDPEHQTRLKKNLRLSLHRALHKLRQGGRWTSTMAKHCKDRRRCLVRASRQDGGRT